MLAVYDDRHEDATQSLDRAAAYAAYRGRHSIGSYFLGLLAIRTGQLDQAIDVLTAAAAVDGPNALAQARIAQAHAWRGDSEQMGAMLRRDGERRRARAELHDAYTAFERCGARGLAAAADAEANSVSGRRPGDSSELTATERRVAELVATGLTNTEVARMLHVTVKTVETHLAHAYRKLGVHNRTELGRRLS